MNVPETVARRRWLALVAIRFAGMAGAILGLVLAARAHALAPRLIGVALVLAGLSPVVTLTGSLILGLALVERATTADAVWTAATVDETWQAERWGQDAQAADVAAARRAEFDVAAAFLAALAG